MTRRSWSTAWSVGRLLSLRWPYPDDPTGALTVAMQRGIRVHEYTAAWDRGEPFTFVGSEAHLDPYAAAWRDFTRQHSPSWDYIEAVFDGPDYHGIVDRGGSLSGRTVVVEIKTGEGPSLPRTGVQLAAYTRALHGTRSPQIPRLEVRLSRTGRYRIHTHTNLADFLILDELLEQIRDAYESDAEL